MKYKSATLDEIKAAHERFDLKSNQFESSKQFMKEVMFKVPLNKLYSVMASCLYNEENMFCPVLLRINDAKILE